ncbi:outer membrane assembly protein AsmA [Pluralibacter gergoviae]|uniref:outer membrane assembly protein AsmA n=1 Tax=Pluralibacter gergoviae TaxID=61647 RepID=UPI0005ECE535|nr:outer membrane assembly protein AsmA [Pluralibacter gergoviae]ELG9929451.1 outer membrane assembly protein AsmA [Pluralibacter gergoviae]ELK5591854.1 outer membrane assembly protein AsmA [Pluralibacter gergoviae]KJM65391.1 assembly protein [Pluralibacter gergoviae]MDU4432647.1 outer membrane assembly protein AsmA [Pluralibacter gergoviae]OUR03690.1 outer membrane assembly protein AsmA [Pluralibacter gergoviae]
MRRLLTTLMILLVVIVAGLSALVLLVNPNDFRHYLIDQVASRSGYQLELDGRLRWHVWPQLSILTGRMSLTEPGASAPLVRADNMRLDVALIPLLSHQLKVKQVMLKGAVIELTPQTEAVRDGSAPVAPRENTLPLESADRGWSFDVSSLKVHDSVLVFQHADDEQVTVRGIDLEMQQDEHHRAEVDFSGRINRDQRDLTIAFNAQVNAGDYPQNLTATFNRLNWQLKGADLPPQGIVGQGSLQAQWQEAAKKLSFSQLQLTANDSTLRGEGSVALSDRPQWTLNLQSDKLNLDNLMVHADAVTDGGTGGQGQARQQPLRPVIADSAPQPDYASLRAYRADFSFQASQLQWRGMNFVNVRAQAQNNRGLLTVSHLSGELGKGTLSLPGTLDAREDVPRARFRPALKDIEIGALLKAFNYPIELTGELSLNGDFNGGKIDADSFRRSWDGQASLALRNSRAQGLNFQQLVQQAVARSANVKVQDSFTNATELDSLTSELSLDSGMLSLDDMAGQSQMLALTGEGTLDLVHEEGDVRFNIRVLDGWEGQSKLIETLKTTPVPLRVYGKWTALNYSLQVDQVLRKSLQDEARSKLQKWADKNQDRQSGRDVKKFLDKL